MAVLSRIAALWRNLTRRSAVERDLDDEVRSTLAMLVDEKLRAGSSGEAAERQARLELGGVESVKDQIRDAKAGAFADVLIQDLRFAVRLLRRNRLFTLTATVSLAIGIGANTTIFSIANALFFRAPAGVTDPDRIVDIGVSRNSDQGFNPGSYPDFLDIRQRATMLDGVYAASLFGKRMGLQTSDRSLAAPIFVSSVTANFFAVLGAHSSAGRLFEESDATTLEVTPLVLSHSFWTRFFSRDRGVVGRTLQLDGRPFVVVGVAAERFQGIRLVAPDAWLPISTVSDNPNESAAMTNRNASWLAMGARLRREASLAQAAAELDAIGRVLQREHPDESRGKNLRLKATSRLPGGDVPVAVFLALMMGVVTLVLAVACANVAGVLLARAASRRQEIAVRLAMGASRARLARQLLTETVMLFACGAGAGLLLAVVLTSVFVSLLPALPFPVDLSLPLDGRVVAFAIGLSLTAALFSGLAPALQSSRTDVAGVLKSAGPMLAGRSRLRSAFVVAQLASSIVLVVSAGLFVRALQRAGALNPGFEAQGVELATVDFTIAGYSDATAPAFARELAARVAALPSVESATIAKTLPGGFESLRFGVTVPGIDAPNGQPGFDTDWNIVEPGYFATLRIPLVSGRDFNGADRAGRPGVAILSEGAARRLWPGENAIGKFVIQHLGPGSTRTLVIVGVVRDINASSLVDGFANPLVYVPLQQQYTNKLPANWTIAARARNGRRLAADVRILVASMNPNLPIVTSQTLDDSVALGLMPKRIAAALSSSLGLIGLLLAAIGVYGVAAYAVARRTREIGIRVALGARPAAVVAMVLRHGLSLAGLGAVIGLAAAAGVSRLLSGLLFGVPAFDMAIFAGAAALAAAVGVAGCYVPARRAVTINAIEALRYE